MYQPRAPGYHSQDPVMRWALPDRVFFAFGACHIFVHVFLERHGAPEQEVIWIKPAAGYWEQPHLCQVSGLRVRLPWQFLHDPLPRARRYLDRFPAPERQALG